MEIRRFVPNQRNFTQLTHNSNLRTPFQAGEYFILACIMAGAAFLFMLLSTFYYEYVDPKEFKNAEDDNEKSSQKSIKEEDVDSGVDEEKTEEKTNSETTDF